jgi:hypothetical protein
MVHEVQIASDQLLGLVKETAFYGTALYDMVNTGV